MGVAANQNVANVQYFSRHQNNAVIEVLEVLTNSYITFYTTIPSLPITMPSSCILADLTRKGDFLYLYRGSSGFIVYFNDMRSLDTIRRRFDSNRLANLVGQSVV